MWTRCPPRVVAQLYTPTFVGMVAAWTPVHPVYPNHTCINLFSTTIRYIAMSPKASYPLRPVMGRKKENQGQLSVDRQPGSPIGGITLPAVLPFGSGAGFASLTHHLEPVVQEA